ncbi:hypothetical protein TrRE_jg3567, partial [Triparma retinervis]
SKPNRDFVRWHWSDFVLQPYSAHSRTVVQAQRDFVRWHWSDPVLQPYSAHSRTVVQAQRDFVRWHWSDFVLQPYSAHARTLKPDPGAGTSVTRNDCEIKGAHIWAAAAALCQNTHLLFNTKTLPTLANTIHSCTLLNIEQHEFDFFSKIIAPQARQAAIERSITSPNATA